MRETPGASSKCISALIECLDERTGSRVQTLLDSLYEQGYSQDEICDALRSEFSDTNDSNRPRKTQNVAGCATVN